VEILTSDNAYLREKRNLHKGNNRSPPSKGGRRGSKNPQQFATAKLIRNNQQVKQQIKTELATNTGPARPQELPHRSCTAMEETAGQLHLSLTWPKCHLATFKLIAKDELGS